MTTTDSYDVDRTVRLVSRESQGFELTYNLTEPRNHSYIVGGTVVANCSEYVHLDNSSCNLASINLLKFLSPQDTFDVERFERITELVITAMDISICFADFPTQKITETTRAYRQLGIGYANLGALLMATGHAYDSEGGRSIAGAITSLMTGTAYRRSANSLLSSGPTTATSATPPPTSGSCASTPMPVLRSRPRAASTVTSMPRRKSPGRSAWPSVR